MIRGPTLKVYCSKKFVVNWILRKLSQRQGDHNLTAWSNEYAEVCKLCRQHMSVNQKDWADYIPLLMMAYRSSVHDTAKCTPCSMMLGRKIRLPTDLALGISETRQSKCEADYAYELEQQLIKIHDTARKHI